MSKIMDWDDGSPGRLKDDFALHLTIQIRELKLVDDIHATTEHGDRVIIPAGTVFRVAEEIWR